MCSEKYTPSDLKDGIIPIVNFLNIRLMVRSHLGGGGRKQTALNSLTLLFSTFVSHHSSSFKKKLLSCVPRFPVKSYARQKIQSYQPHIL